MKFLLALSLLVLPHLSHAISAKQLSQSCQPEAHDSDLQTFHKSGCVFFIRGVIDTHETFTAIKRVKPVFCEPDNLTFATIESVFNHWMELNEDKQAWTAADAVLSALAERFPCTPDEDSAEQ
ncbi:MAG: hypothetical protein HOM11_05560 [Methylococcales bacterium]|jgi:hypothetical protein|nr:hypothetical protein [Methylococcales bacterium]MBT7443174.1 hypothetical protein [Methylococcales bacterium]